MPLCGKWSERIISSLSEFTGMLSFFYDGITFSVGWSLSKISLWWKRLVCFGDVSWQVTSLVQAIFRSVCVYQKDTVYCSSTKMIHRSVAIMMQVTKPIFPTGSILDVLCIIQALQKDACPLSCLSLLLLNRWTCRWLQDQIKTLVTTRINRKMDLFSKYENRNHRWGFQKRWSSGFESDSSTKSHWK